MTLHQCREWRAFALRMCEVLYYYCLFHFNLVTVCYQHFFYLKQLSERLNQAELDSSECIRLTRMLTDFETSMPNGVNNAAETAIIMKQLSDQVKV